MTLFPAQVVGRLSPQEIPTLTSDRRAFNGLWRFSLILFVRAKSEEEIPVLRRYEAAE